MTLEEARKIAAIAGTVDGGCAGCCEDVVERLNSAFPEFAWTVLDDFYERPENERVLAERVLVEKRR